MNKQSKIFISVLGIALFVGSQTTARSASITNLTMDITGGTLTISAPASLDIGSWTSPSTASISMGTVTVLDYRGVADSGWIVSAIATALTPTTGPAIAANLMGYDPGTIANIGTVTTVGHVVTLLDGVMPVITGSLGSGSETVTWNPTLTVRIPAAVANGTYTATLTHSVL